MLPANSCPAFHRAPTRGHHSAGPSLPASNLRRCCCSAMTRETPRRQDAKTPRRRRAEVSRKRRKGLETACTQGRMPLRGPAPHPTHSRTQADRNRSWERMGLELCWSLIARTSGHERCYCFFTVEPDAQRSQAPFMPFSRSAAGCDINRQTQWRLDATCCSSASTNSRALVTMSAWRWMGHRHSIFPSPPPRTGGCHAGAGCHFRKLARATTVYGSLALQIDWA